MTLCDGMSQEPWNVLHNALTAGERIRSGLAFKASNPTHAAFSNLAPDLACWTIDPCAGKERWATSSEHEFQANKTTDPTARDSICSATTPKQAKSLGASLNLRMAPHVWESGEAEAALHEANSKKFRQNPAARDLLLSTGGEGVYLYESSGDKRWGLDAHGRGDNQMGRTLMTLRRELRDDREQESATEAFVLAERRTERKRRAAIAQTADKAKQIARQLAKKRGITNWPDDSAADPAPTTHPT